MQKKNYEYSNISPCKNIIFKNPLKEIENLQDIITLLVWPVPLAQVLAWPKLIFPSKTWVFRIYLNFQQQRSLKNRYLPHSESKSCQINSSKSSRQDLSNNTKGTFQFLWNFQLWFNLIFIEKIIQYSSTSTWQVQMPWNQVDAPLLLESCPKRPRTRSEAMSWCGGSHKYKQNKETTLIHR